MRRQEQGSTSRARSRRKAGPPERSTRTDLMTPVCRATGTHGTRQVSGRTAYASPRATDDPGVIAHHRGNASADGNGQARVTHGFRSVRVNLEVSGRPESQREERQEGRGEAVMPAGYRTRSQPSKGGREGPSGPGPRWTAVERPPSTNDRPGTNLVNPRSGAGCNMPEASSGANRRGGGNHEDGRRGGDGISLAEARGDRRLLASVETRCETGAERRRARRSRRRDRTLLERPGRGARRRTEEPGEEGRRRLQ